MFLTIELCQNTIRAWKYMGLLMYILKIVVGLIVIVQSTITIMSTVTKASADTAMKSALSIAKKAAAAVIVFMVPSLVITAVNFFVKTNNKEEFAACEICFKEPNDNKCTAAIIEFDKKVREEAEAFKLKKLEGDLDTCELGLSGSPALDFSYKGNGTVKTQFTSETMRIVEKHLNDFNNSSFHRYLNSRGGLKNYSRKLGGIFQRYYGKKWEGKTVKDLQEASEYVFGYMTMYGFDYFNGKGENGHYCKWGGGCLYYKDVRKAVAEGKLDEIVYPSGASDAFYPGNMIYDKNGLSHPLNNFDKLIQRDNMTTNCNWTVDMIYHKAGIFGKNGSSGFEDYEDVLNNGKIITKLCDLRVGDLLHFFEKPVDHTNRATWDGWRHVAFIGEIDSETGTITVYDGGSGSITKRNFKWTFSGKGEWPSSLKGFAGWSAVRAIELKY